ncbi:PREDICTED: major allergen I polypeptide chain 2-like [Bison bison bison]|uniref:Major allergen I polypeptide chain 2-like n=1 Tax=Bison bison bison TaxID=43346 RepID=A0A6P3HXH4_BISBB|nr:PREDICTED: major allergen I polypeptide chain 2-like [Bison bison bison]
MMKGALLVLALMVTRELIFQTTEACPVFYGVFGTLILGSKTLLNTTLDFVAATDEEKAALGKIQDCYDEAGFDDKALDLLLMGSIISDNDCNGYQVSLVLSSVFGIILNEVSLVQ